MKQKVCHLTSAHPRYDMRIFQKECISLADAGYDVFLVVNDNKESEIKNGVNIISTAYVARNRIDRMLNSTRAVFQKALEIDADLYHFHDPELLPVGVKLKKKGKKVIFDSHEFTGKQLESRYYLPQLLRGPIAFFYRAYEKKAVHGFDAVVVPCTYAGEHYFDRKCKREILLDNLPKLDEVCLDVSNLEDRKKQACYIGSLSRERGIREIVQASVQKKIPLVLAGSFAASNFKSEILEQQAEDYIDYRGMLGREEIKQLLSETYIGMCVLRDVGQYKYLDNLPTKLYEYMGAGMPVVVSNFPYYKKIVEQYQCGICVEPDDTESIASAMEWLLRHPDEAEKMGANGKRFVRERANWSVEEKKLIALYRELLEGI